MAAVLQLNVTDWLKGLGNLKAKANPALSRALNRTGTSANVVMVRNVAGDLGLKQADVKGFIRLSLSTPANLRVIIEARGERIPLIKFNARDRFPKGVSARMPGGVGRYPNAFVRTMRSGHTGVFTRKGGARLPIVELRGPSAPHVFAKHIPAGLARADEQLPKNLGHEISYVLRQLSA